MPEKCICIECGKQFTVKPYKKNIAKFCSNECRNKNKRGQRTGEWIIKTCPSCGKEFESLKSRNKKYCSDKCLHDKNELYMICTCDYCHKEFRVKKSYYRKLLDGRQKTITCSKECANKIKHTGHNISCDNCGKIFYRRQYHINRQEKHFCCTKCEFDYHHKEHSEERQCEICGTIFRATKSSSQRFCSIVCQCKWQSTQIGIINPRYKRIEVKCDYCNKKIYVKKYKVESEQNHFCSIICRQDWFANIWSQTEECKNKSREIMINLLTSGKISKTNSKPQQIIDCLLSSIGINFKKEYGIKYYCIDNYLFDFNLMIEVQGDYWHSNPNIFKDSLTETQYKRISRDKAKHTYIKKYFDIEVLYLWENDIYNNLELCKNLIDLYIKSNGKLINYHSFNYHIDNNSNLCLRENIVTPYQDMKVEQYKHLCKHVS